MRTFIVRTFMVLCFTALPPGLAHEPNRERTVDPNAPVATVSITSSGAEQPSLVEVRLEPGSANRGELYLSLSQAGRYKRRVLQPSAPGVYRLRYTFPAPGDWNVYLRYGPGQAGLVTWLTVNVSPPSGRGEALSKTVSARFEDGFARDVPEYVQPLGYAAFLLLTSLALLGITVLLGRIRQVRSSAQPLSVSHS